MNVDFSTTLDEKYRRITGCAICHVGCYCGGYSGLGGGRKDGRSRRLRRSGGCELEKNSPKNIKQASARYYFATFGWLEWKPRLYVEAEDPRLCSVPRNSSTEHIQ